MELKRENSTSDARTDTGDCKRSRKRRQTQQFVGELKGKDMEQAFDEALNYLDHQTNKKCDFKMEKNDNDFADSSKNFFRITTPVSGSMEYKRDHFNGNQSLLSSPMSHGNDENLPVLKTPNGGGICKICGKIFSRITYCKDHFFQIHGESFKEKHLQCLVCKELFAFKKNLSNHMKKIHGISDSIEIVSGYDGLLARSASGKGICLVCSKVFSRLTYCKDHFKLQHKSVESSKVKQQTSQTFKHMNATQQSIKVSAKKTKNQDSKKINNTRNNRLSKCNENEIAGFASFTYMPHSNSSEMNDKLSLGSNAQHQLIEYPLIQELKKEKLVDKTLTNLTLQNPFIHESRKSDILPVKTSLVKNVLEKKSTRNTGNIYASKSLSANSSKHSGIDSLPISKTPNGGGLCELCGRWFSAFPNCKRHFMQLHAESYRQKDIVCIVCKEAFAFDENLSAHMKKTHNITGKVEIVKDSNGLFAKTSFGKGVCLVCGAVISQISNMKRHLKQHDDLSVGNNTLQHDTQMQISKQHDFGPSIVNIQANIPNHIKYEPNRNDASASYIHDAEYSNYTQCKEYSNSNQFDPKNSSEGDVKYQLDSAIDFSMMNEVKSEAVLNN